MCLAALQDGSFARAEDHRVRDHWVAIIRTICGVVESSVGSSGWNTSRAFNYTDGLQIKNVRELICLF